MAVTIDDVVNAQTALGERCLSEGSSKVDAALRAVQNFSIPGYAWSGITIGNHQAPAVQDQLVNVDYVAPVGAPAAFNIEAINQLDPLNLPTAYAIQTNGLFLANPPVGTTGAFTTPAPTVDFAKIDNYLAGIAVPSIDEFAMPTMSNIVIKPVPTVSVPVFQPKTQLETLDKPINQQSYYVAEYERLRPEIKKFIDDGVDSWITKFSPNFHNLLAKAEAKLSDIMDKGRMLRADYQDYLRTKTRAETEAEFNAAVKAIDNDRKRAGFTSLPQAVSSAKQQAQLAKSNALATQEVAREIRLIEMETENVKWAISTAISLRQSLIQSFLGYANVLAQANEQANAQARTYIDLYSTWYEQSYKRVVLLLDALKTEAAIYDTQLKAAMAVLEVYRAELDANKTIIELDSQKLEFVSKQIGLQLAKVQIYSALLGSVETRAKLELSKVELYGKEVDTHNSQLQGDKIRNDIYLAGLSGDEAKLKAEMAKLEAWEKSTDVQIKAKNAEIAMQSNTMDRNKLLIAKYSADWDGFKSQLFANGQVFDNTLKGRLAEIDAYKLSLSAKLDVLKMQYERDKLLLDQDQFNAKQMTEGMKTQVEFTNQHYQFLGTLTNNVGQMYMGAATGVINAQVTAFTSAA
jgi:hypothetical protein